MVELEQEDVYEQRDILTHRIREALRIAFIFSGCKKRDEKAWIIDQMVRALLYDGYDEWIEKRHEFFCFARKEAWNTGKPPKRS